MLAWSIRVSTSSTRGDQPPRCMVADTVNSTSAQVAKTAEPIFGAPSGESSTSSTPPTRASGAVPACSQPRIRGRTSATMSATCPAMCSLMEWAAEREGGTREIYPVPGPAKPSRPPVQTHGAAVTAGVHVSTSGPPLRGRLAVRSPTGSSRRRTEELRPELAERTRVSPGRGRGRTGGRPGRGAPGRSPGAGASASVAPSATASSTAASRSPTWKSRCIIGRCCASSGGQTGGLVAVGLLEHQVAAAPGRGEDGGPGSSCPTGHPSRSA